MVDINRKTYKRNGVETIVDSNGILWVNEKHIEEGLDHKNLWLTTVKYLSGSRKHTYNQVDEQKNNSTEFLYTKNWQPKTLWIPEQQKYINLEQD